MTDAKRREIVETAWEVFRGKGFDGTSMSDVAARLGGSKATLYRYYSSKEELFAAALEQMIGESGSRTFAGLWDEGELEPRLLEFSRIYMANRLRPDMIAIERALIAEGERSELGERLRKQFIEPLLAPPRLGLQPRDARRAPAQRRPLGRHLAVPRTYRSGPGRAPPAWRHDDHRA
jgi:AcrR family transcriptional regulator